METYNARILRGSSNLLSYCIVVVLLRARCGGPGGIEA